LSGSPYMHSDAGGFAMGKRDPELYTRWLQMSVFSPIFRPHGSVNAPDPSIPQIESEPVFYEEPYQSVLRNFIKRRYALMPYTYQLARKASVEGTPLVRPLFYYNSSDANLFKAEDQYMFGDAFLVAPVLQPGAVSRKVYLPEGIWYRFSDHKAMLGGKWIEEPVQLSDIPVFVKEGSIVPMMPSFNNSADYFNQPLHICYYPSPLPSVYQLYEDDGLTKQSTDSKAFELTTIEATPRGKRLKISVQSNKGVYTQRSESRDITVQIPGLKAPPKKALMNGKAYPIHSIQLRQTKQYGVFWNIATEMLMFDIPQYNGDPLVIEIVL
ncbi:MAG: TIM-barrel domain-containing protein, partial [Chitinophagaceae bacterium]